jgi:hypothetical protein
VVPGYEMDDGSRFWNKTYEAALPSDAVIGRVSYVAGKTENRIVGGLKIFRQTL